MSTEIDVYPTISYMPLVEETRARTQELFNDFLRKHDIDSHIEVRALYPSAEGTPHPVPLETRWEIGIDIGFSYWIDDEWKSYSFPSCEARELIDEWDMQPYGDKEPSYPPEMLGRIRPLDVSDFPTPIPEDVFRLMNSQEHYWSERRSAGTQPVGSTGYGFVAAALAEATQGRLFSDDGAFDWERSGETAEQFLQWWGQEQLAYYGADAYRRTRP